MNIRRIEGTLPNVVCVVVLDALITAGVVGGTALVGAAAVGGAVLLAAGITKLLSKR